MMYVPLRRVTLGFNNLNSDIFSAWDRTMCRNKTAGNYEKAKTKRPAMDIGFVV